MYINHYLVLFNAHFSSVIKNRMTSDYMRAINLHMFFTALKNNSVEAGNCYLHTSNKIHEVEKNIKKGLYKL